VRLGSILAGARTSRSAVSGSAPLSHGFTDLERFNILRPGHLTVLVGEPTAARTSLLLNLALEIAMRPGSGSEDPQSDVLIVTCCASADETAARIQALLTGSLVSGSPALRDCESPESVSSVLKQLPLYVSKLPRHGTTHSSTALLGLERVRPPRLVVVDQVDELCQNSDRRAEICRALVELAHREGAAVLAATTERSSAKAGSSHSSDAVTLADLADTLLDLPSTAETRGSATGAPHIVELVITKNRQGPTGRVALTLHPSTGRLRDVEFADCLSA
jgi:replicative DNA helicase